MDRHIKLSLDRCDASKDLTFFSFLGVRADSGQLQSHPGVNIIKSLVSFTIGGELPKWSFILCPI
jgi:hypothetical protein